MTFHSGVLVWGAGADLGFSVDGYEGRVDTAIGNQKSCGAAGFWTLRVKDQRHLCRSVGGAGAASPLGTRERHGPLWWHWSVGAGSGRQGSLEGGCVSTAPSHCPRTRGHRLRLGQRGLLSGESSAPSLWAWWPVLRAVPILPQLPRKHRVVLLPVGLLLCGALTWPSKTLWVETFCGRAGCRAPDMAGQEGMWLLQSRLVIQ